MAQPKLEPFPHGSGPAHSQPVTRVVAVQVATRGGCSVASGELSGSTWARPPGFLLCGAHRTWGHARRRPARIRTPDTGARASVLHHHGAWRRRAWPFLKKLRVNVACVPATPSSGSKTIRAHKGSGRASRSTGREAAGHGQCPPTGGGVARVLCPRRSFVKTGGGRLCTTKRQAPPRRPRAVRLHCPATAREQIPGQKAGSWVPGPGGGDGERLLPGVRELLGDDGTIPTPARGGARKPLPCAYSRSSRPGVRPGAVPISPPVGCLQAAPPPLHVPSGQAGLPPSAPPSTPPTRQSSHPSTCPPVHPSRPQPHARRERPGPAMPTHSCRAQHGRRLGQLCTLLVQVPPASSLDGTPGVGAGGVGRLPLAG